MQLEPAVITGTSLHPGRAIGELLVLDDALSLWGGVDPTGTITAVRHPQDGRSITGRIVAMPATRGSSSSASVLAELLRAGTGPAALVLVDVDTILVVGALVAAELYGITIPIMQVSRNDFADLGTGTCTIECPPAAGRAILRRAAPSETHVPSSATGGSGPDGLPVDHPVNRQLDAYNAHRLDDFVACFAAEIRLVKGDGTIAAEGHAQLRAVYVPTFERVDRRVTIANRITVGTWVIDHEVVDDGDNRRFEALVAYRLVDDEIVEMHVLD